MISANTRETWFKNPITVTRRKKLDEDGKQLDIVCGYETRGLRSSR